MKWYLIILAGLLSNDPRDIAKVNSLKKEAYLNGNFELAASTYGYLSDSLGVDEDLIHLNLAHSYYQLGDTTGAKTNYGKVGSSSDRSLKSIAYQQLGVMSKESGKLEESLQQLKSAIKADPSNRDAIYDYEVVKKLLEEQQKQEQQNQDQQNQDQQDKEGDDQKNQEKNKNGEEQNKDQEGENQEQSEQEQQEGEQQEQDQKEGEQQEQTEQEQEKSQEQMTKEKLQEMGISEEKARQLLEAMRQSEIKYLQNQKRKATKRPPSGKPDW